VEADWAALPFRISPEKVRLGRWLFYDARLSADGAISCATCHVPAHGFSEEAPVSTGIRGQKGTRKSPPILNAGWPVSPVFFWDGRAASLAEQAKGPIANPVEMGHTLEGATAAIAAIPGYRPYFREAFGDDAVTIDRIAEAIAAYEATRLSGNSRWDRFRAGDETALGELERHGEALFNGVAGCNACHLGPNLTDGQFHNIGIGYEFPGFGRLPELGFADQGRFAVTGDERDMGAFKTPTLRDVSKRAPYMHDGSVPDLEEAVLHYWRGGIPNPWQSDKLVRFPLSRHDLDALVAFLRALDGEGYLDAPPKTFPR
ncbi:MAG TPA: cytochrome c peroxidase, partial [Anaeromyxobacteraceae bacterium]|nr:cytochrome c peroxidase [Anaeromyxobacteraceae bacterium]